MHTIFVYQCSADCSTLSFVKSNYVRDNTFTDYKSQGQTIEYIIIDIRRPPTGSLSPFSVYVALLRSRGRETIRLLRDFNPNLFQNQPSEALRSDMRRLERLNKVTRREWLMRGYEKRMAHARLKLRIITSFTVPRAGERLFCHNRRRQF